MLSAQRAYKAPIGTKKRKLISTQIDKAGQRGCQQRTQAIFNWYKYAEGKTGAGSKEFLGQRATLKYRHFKETCVSSKQVAEGLSRFTEEVSLGRDLVGNKNEAYKAENREAQATIMRDPTSGRRQNPITTSNIRAALKKLNQKLRKAPGKDGLANWMIAWAGARIVEPLRLLFIAMWASNTTPEHMTDVLVEYIPKHSLEISGYMPISLISCLGKLYTMVWLPSLTDKLQPHITPKTSTLKSSSKFRVMASAQSHTHNHCLLTAGFGGAPARSHSHSLAPPHIHLHSHLGIAHSHLGCWCTAATSTLWLATATCCSHLHSHAQPQPHPQPLHAATTRTIYCGVSRQLSIGGRFAD